jgi:hypothetical protein
MRTRSESSVTESKLAMLALTGADRASSDHDPLRYRSYSNLPRQRTESNVYAGYRSEYQLYRRGAVSDNKGQKRSRFDSINDAKEAKTLTQPAPNQFDEEIKKTCGQWCMSKIRGYRHTQIIKEEMVESLRRYNVQSSGDATPFADTCDVTSYINKDRKEIRFSVEKDRKLYRKQEDGDKKLITKLTYTKGNPAKILDQNDDGPDDVPWHVVNKLKELAVLAGVENNLPQDRGEVFRNDGFTSEDISRVFYDYIKPIASENLDIMTNLRLDKTCGLKNVKDFEDTESNEKHLPEKIFWFWYLLFSVVFNMSSLLIMNWGVFQTYARGIERTLIDLHLQSNLTQGVMYAASQASQVSRSAIEKSYLKATFSERIHDQSTQQTFLSIAAIVAGGDCLGLLGLTAMSMVHIFTFLCDASEYRQYMAIYKLMQRRLPEFSTFSSLRLMHKVHPTLLYLELFNHMALSSCTTNLGRYISGVWFILYRILFGAMGLCALAVKILAVGLMLLNPVCSVIFKSCALVSLMVQCMGCIHMEHVLQDRIMLLVFGGQDACYSDDELAYRNVFQARLAKEIWTIFRHQSHKKQRDDVMQSELARDDNSDCEAGCCRRQDLCKSLASAMKGTFKALVMLATFDHYDLQWILVQGTMNLEHKAVNDENHPVYIAQDGRYYCQRTFSHGQTCAPVTGYPHWTSCESCERFSQEALLRERLENTPLARLIDHVDQLRRDQKVDSGEVDDAINVGDDIDAPTKKSLIEFMLTKRRNGVELDLQQDRQASRFNPERTLGYVSEESLSDSKWTSGNGATDRHVTFAGPCSQRDGDMNSVASRLEAIKEDDMKEVETGGSLSRSERRGSEISEDKASNIGEDTIRYDENGCIVSGEDTRNIGCDNRRSLASNGVEETGCVCSIKEELRMEESVCSIASISSTSSGRSTGMNAISRALRRTEPAYDSYQPMVEVRRGWASGE